MTAVKALLGVRVTTCSDICLVELGLPPVAAIIKDKHTRLFQTMLRARSTMADDPFMYCLNLTLGLHSRNKTASCRTGVLDSQGEVRRPTNFGAGQGKTQCADLYCIQKTGFMCS